MQKTRRNFILGTGAAVVASAFQRLAADGGPASAPPDIRSLLESSGFDPDNPGSALLAIVGDVHINLAAGDSKFTDHFDDSLVAELNGLTPPISDLALAGDLIVHNSVSVGGNRYEGDYAMSRLEFRNAKTQIQRFRPSMTVRAVPGNHDTDKLEVDAELWREEVQLPPYQKTVLGGVPVFFLNSGHAGMPDPAQISWFQSEVALIHPDQEVLIIAHHPSFFYRFEETGLKRVVSQALANHRAPVWLAGGHGHAFGELLLTNGDARFVQMMVTNGNPIQWGDGKSPGYILLALQDGRVVQRLFRSLNDPGFQSRQPLGQIQATPLKWPFDSIEFPVALFDEGFYSRPGRLIGFDGIDLKSHIILCKNYTVRVDLSNSRGKIVEFLLSANIAPSLDPPTCLFSPTGLPGSWTSVAFPTSNGGQVYRIVIPAEFRTLNAVYISTRSALQGTTDGISICGWGLAASGASLTAYERWLSSRYRAILPTGQSAPTAIPAGGSLTNLEYFAFNIPVPSSLPLPGGPNPPPSGAPVYSLTFRRVMDFSFARRIQTSQSLVSYAVEQSSDLIHWTTVSEDRLHLTPLDDSWEEVRYTVLPAQDPHQYFRARITSLTGAQSTAHLSSGDLNGDGIDDLLQYAFDLQSATGGFRPYDPARPIHKAGIPVQNFRTASLSRFVYPRMRAAARPGVNYFIEQSPDLQVWTRVPVASIAERVIRSIGDWDEVEAIMMNSNYQQSYYRFALDLAEPLPL